MGNYLVRTVKKTMEKRALLNSSQDKPFHVRCVAGQENGFDVGADSLTLTVGQRIRRDGVEQVWHSAGVYAQEEEDGTLVVRVLVFNPDWDEPLQIACIRSRPGDVTSLTALGCNLDHVAEPQAYQRIESPFRSPPVRGGNPKA